MRKIYELRAELECELWRNGQKIFWHAQPCQSFTKWFKRIVGNFLSGNGNSNFTQLQIKDTSGNLRTILKVGSSGKPAMYGNVVTNIAIGTSDAAFDYEQYELQSKLMSATGLTKSIDLQDYDTSVRFELTGTFNIRTETDIKETGLYGWATDTNLNDYNFLASRDILSTPIHVVPGDVLFVRYRITIS
jgi:hypothetical protein